jgi:hypothetical protein
MGTNIAIVDQDQRVVELSAKAKALIDHAEAIEITDDESDYEAVEFIANVKATRKSWDELRHFFTDPLEAHKKSIIARFKPDDQGLEQAEKIAGRKHINYTTAKEEAARKEQERLRKLAEAKQARQAAKAAEKGLEAPPVVIPMPTVEAPAKTVHTAAGKVTMRSVWKAEVIDFNLLPDEYKVADEVKIGKVVRAGVRQIPGVRIYEEKSI